MARDPEDWRRRLTGRVAFDQTAAEAAIRRVYRAGGLPGPTRILWARGPTEAGELLRFLCQPPPRQRLVALGLLAGGAVLWTVLAATFGQGPSEEPRKTLALIGAVLAFYLVREGARALPSPGAGGAAHARGPAVWSGLLVYVLLVGSLLLFREAAVATDPVAHAGALVLVAGAGALPGAMLFLRQRRAYREIPEWLRNLVPGRSAVRPLLRARSRRLSGRPAADATVRAGDSLRRAYQSAYEEAFAIPGDLIVGPGAVGPAGRDWRHADTAWMVPGSMRLANAALLRPVAHLDGIDDAEIMSGHGGAETEELEAFSELAYRVDRLFPFRDVALAVHPPTVLSVDADGRPHAEAGPALAWADGTEVHAWRGRVVERDLIDPAIPLTLWRIRAERDPDRQSVLIERYGLGRFLVESAAAEIQVDSCGALYRLDQRGEPVVAVRVINGTAEPDGRVREFWLRVPPTVATAREAVAWTFGLPADEYDPVAQS